VTQNPVSYHSSTTTTTTTDTLVKRLRRLVPLDFLKALLLPPVCASLSITLTHAVSFLRKESKQLDGFALHAP
jgi:hypothetical protein